MVLSLFLGSLVLEPDLDAPDGQTGLLGHLFPHQSRWSRSLSENVQHQGGLLLGELGPRRPLFGL